MVEASHFPFGAPAYEPSFARAFWISEMRSGVGAFCPRSRRLDLLDDFLPCDAPPALEEGFLGVVVCACAEFANTPSPAASSSVRARWIAFRVRIVNSVWLSSVVSTAAI